MKKGIFYTIDDYIITEKGEVINKHNGHKLIPQQHGNGYLKVTIGHRGCFIHRLVAEKYLPNPENKPQVNHKDGNKENNCIENLEWVTNQENRNHAVKSGLHLRGEQCPYAKLKEKDAIYILQHKDIPTRILCQKFNVSQATIDDIKKGRTWKHLKRYADLQQNEVVEIEDKKPL